MKKAFVQTPPKIIVNKIVKRSKKGKSEQVVPAPAQKTDIVVAKKVPPLKVRVKNALLGKGGTRGSRKVNEDQLNADQEMFCELYTTAGEFFGNGVDSYIEAYDVTVGHNKKAGEMTIESCRARASQLLTNLNVLKRIDDLLDGDGFNEQYADKTLLFLMRQKANLNVTLGAISEFNKVKGRIRDKVDHTHKLLGVVRMVYDEADRLAREPKKPAKKKTK